jgi:hypothetical protein
MRFYLRSTVCVRFAHIVQSRVNISKLTTITDVAAEKVLAENVFADFSV